MSKDGVMGGKEMAVGAKNRALRLHPKKFAEQIDGLFPEDSDDNLPHICGRCNSRSALILKTALFLTIQHNIVQQS